MLALKEKKARKLNLLAFEGTPKFGKKNTSLKPLRRNVQFRFRFFFPVNCSNKSIPRAVQLQAQLVKSKQKQLRHCITNKKKQANNYRSSLWMSTVVKSRVDVRLAIWICSPTGPVNNGKYHINSDEYDWVNNVQ